MTDAVAPWAARYIGVPFVPGGRDRNGADCWGLARMVYAEVFSCALPAFAEARWSRAQAVRLAAFIDKQARQPWRKVASDATRTGDIMLYAVGGRPAHVGVKVATCRVLTTAPLVGGHLARADSPRLGARFLSAWRHEA